MHVRRGIKSALESAGSVSSRLSGKHHHNKGDFHVERRGRLDVRSLSAAVGVFSECI